MTRISDEYNRLGRHIERQFSLITQVFTISVIVSVALLGYVLRVLSEPATSSEFEPFLLLAPLAIVIPCAYLISSLRKEVFKWGMYIKVYLEDGTNWKYETELEKSRDRFPFRESFDHVATTYWALLIICGSLFGYTIYQVGMCFLWLLILAIPVVAVLDWHLGYTGIPRRYGEEYNRMWKEIREMGNAEHQVQQDSKSRGMQKKLDELGHKVDALSQDNKRWQKRQSIFAAALSGLALAVSLTIYGSQSGHFDVVLGGIALWVISFACFVYLAFKG